MEYNTVAKAVQILKRLELQLKRQATAGSQYFIGDQRLKE
jgi:hypothetical protein